jgi:hypothetical protein
VQEDFILSKKKNKNTKKNKKSAERSCRTARTEPPITEGSSPVLVQCLGVMLSKKWHGHFAAPLTNLQTAGDTIIHAFSSD